MVLPQFAHDSQLCTVIWFNTFNYKWDPVFVAGGQDGGLTSGWEGGDSEAFLFLLAGV